MRKFDKKEAWENAEVVYWRDNTKYRETLQHFFQEGLCITFIRR